MIKSIAIIQENHKLQMVETPLPPMNSDEILVKTLKTGICSTERELLEQEIHFPDQDDYLILGHEAIGEVVDIGADVSQFQKRDIVAPTVRRGCGECPFCNNGRTDMCSTGKYKERGIVKLHGFMSEYFIEKEENLTKVPNTLKSQAVLLEPLTVGIKAIEEYFKIQRSRLCTIPNLSEKQILKNVLVIGAGPIGLLTALIATHYNVNLTCIDIDEEGGIKSNITRMMGGQYINIGEYIEKDKINIAGLRENRGIGEIDLILDASPDPITCLQLIDLLNFNGAIVYLGLPYGNKKRPSNLLDHYISSLVLKNSVILGSVNAKRTDFDKGRDYLEQSQQKFGDILDKIVTHRFHFLDYQEAFNIQSTDRIKVVLEWGSGPYVSNSISSGYRSRREPTQIYFG